MTREVFREFVQDVENFEKYASDLAEYGIELYEIPEIVKPINDIVNMLGVAVDEVLEYLDESALWYYLYEKDLYGSGNHGKHHYIKTLDDLCDYYELELEDEDEDEDDGECYCNGDCENCEEYKRQIAHDNDECDEEDSYNYQDDFVFSNSASSKPISIEKSEDSILSHGKVKKVAPASKQQTAEERARQVKEKVVDEKSEEEDEEDEVESLINACNFLARMIKSLDDWNA